MEQRTVESFFFLILLVGTLVLVVFMFWPFVAPLFLAAVLALLLWQVNERLSARLGSRSVAALITTLGSLVAILAPLGFMLWLTVQEAADLYVYLHAHATPAAIMHVIDIVWTRIGPMLPWLSVDNASIVSALQSVLTWIVSHTGSVFASIGSTFFNGFILLFALFFFLRDGSSLLRAGMDLSPLSDKHERNILDTIARTVGATVRGKLLISLLQGIMAGIGFWLFGIPAPALWGAAVLLASFVPTLGTALIVVPMVIYLLATSTLSVAVGLAVWSLLTVGLLDNFLGPRLMAQGTQSNQLIMFLSVLGGLALFGPIGILLGPVVIAFQRALFDIYRSLVKTKSQGKEILGL